MRLNKEEIKFLDDKWNDIYYALQVDEMFEKDQEIFKILVKIIGGKTMRVIKMVAKCTSYHVIAVACPDDVTEMI